MANYHLNDSKVKFTYFNYNKGILFDEKKKRFVDFSDMDLDTYLNYKRSFTTVKSFFNNQFSKLNIQTYFVIIFKKNSPNINII